MIEIKTQAQKLRSCSGKVPYTRKVAKEVATQTKKRHGRVMDIYPCAQCGQHHLTKSRTQSGKGVT